MLELISNTLNFSFPEVHEGARMSIDLMRTLRIPDDNREYPLPPGLGSFPLVHVDDHKDRVPPKWLAHGGVIAPMYQSEALWLYFHGRQASSQGVYPFAVKVSTGKISAITGDDWVNGIRLKDYCVVPNQKWLDGYVVEDGLVRQFVAAPLGSGVTAEEQITGKADHGGIQIEVFPMKAEVFNRRFPKREEKTGGGILRQRRSGNAIYPASANSNYFSAGPVEISEHSLLRSCDDSGDDFGFAVASADMGLAAGGKMKQQVIDDPYEMSDWDTEHGGRVFIHLANSLVWKAITRQDPPHPPQTAADYTAHGLPWFDYYTDNWKTLAGTGKLKGLKTLLQMGFQKGVQVLPENQPVQFKSDQVKVLGVRRPNEVRVGSW